MSGQCRLDFGPLDLVSADGDAGDYRFGVIGEDVQFGQPQPVEVSVASLMADGSPTNTTRWENREAGFQVTIEAADSQGLADGEAALAALIGTRTTLTWQPPDGYGPPSVFEVETSSMEFLFSDLNETRQTKRRTYRLRLVCLPWVRSATPTTVGSAFVADSLTVADTCESTTGWSTTGGYTGTFTVDTTAGNFVAGTGAVKLISTPYPYTGSNYVTGNYASTSTKVHKDLSIDGSAGGYLVMHVRTDWTLDVAHMAVSITTSGGGKQAVPTVVAQAAANGYTKFAWPIPNASTITGWDATIQQTSDRFNTGAQPPNPGIWFDQIGTSAAAAGAQSARVFEVGGSARSEGTIQVSAGTGLGDTLLYTAPDKGDGFRPDLRRWQVSGTTGSDTASATGTYTSIATTSAIEAPLSMFRPGSYAVMAQVRTTTTAQSNITVTAQAKVGGTLIGAQQSFSTSFIVPDYTNYHVAYLGTLDLPPVVMDPASAAKVLFQIYGGNGDARVGELLVFPLDDAALTWVECGYGTPGPTVASRLWLDAPSPSQPRGALRVGTDQYRADARAIVPRSRGRHLLYPGPMLAYLLTSAAGGAAMSTTYFKRWHSNAGE